MKKKIIVVASCLILLGAVVTGIVVQSGKHTQTESETTQDRIVTQEKITTQDKTTGQVIEEGTHNETSVAETTTIQTVSKGTGELPETLSGNQYQDGELPVIREDGSLQTGTVSEEQPASEKQLQQKNTVKTDYPQGSAGASSPAEEQSTAQNNSSTAYNPDNKTDSKPEENQTGTSDRNTESASKNQIIQELPFVPAGE